MFDIPMIDGNIRILRFLSLIYGEAWRRIVFLLIISFLVFTQICYLFFTNDSIDEIIGNAYTLVLWFNTILRAILMIQNQEQYQRLIADMVCYYRELMKSDESYIQDLLKDGSRVGKIMSQGNLFLGTLTCVGFTISPIFSSHRELPFGILVPGINEYETPYYEILYFYHVLIIPIGCSMYIPYTNLIVALIMFGIIMCKVLQHRLRKIDLLKGNIVAVNMELIECIKYQKRIIKYTSTINDLTMFIFSVEFLAFGALLCALLFLLIIVETAAQSVIVCAYITMIFAQILALYWYANELKEQSLAVANAIYDTNWFTLPTYIQKHIKLLIVRAQKPCTLRIANTYPITLELFQSLLNASYSFFTLLKRVYN